MTRNDSEKLTEYIDSSGEEIQLSEELANKIDHLETIKPRFEFLRTKLMQKNFEDISKRIKHHNYQHIMDLYQNMLQQLDTSWRRAEKMSGYHSSCHKGCSHCCYNNMITIGYPEAFIIRDYINTHFTEEQKALLKQRIKEQLILIKKNGITGEIITDADMKGLSDAKPIIEIKKRYFQLKLPCIFLYDEECLVYDVKPADCWAFKQYISEDLCKDSFMIIGSEDYLEVKVNILALLQSFYINQINFNQRMFIDTLPAMLDRVLNHPSLQ